MNHLRVTLPPGLVFVGTPIGTARDITLRALDVLASADVLAAEDTRSLRRLMDIHAVPLDGRPLVSYHDHSPDRAVTRLLSAIEAGQSVAYASEAGMPLIADPGFALARAVSAAGYPVTAAPGPSALTTALALGGLPTDAVFFAGFLPAARRARQTRLTELSAIPGTLVIYESPKRLAALLADAADSLGPDRQARVCRELTKKFEEVRAGRLQELADHYGDAAPKGEIVVLIGAEGGREIREIDIESDLESALQTMRVKDAADVVSRAHGLPRRQVYQMALRLSAQQKDDDA